MYVERKKTLVLIGLRRICRVLTALALACITLPALEPHAFDLDELTIADLQEGMRTGTYSSRAILSINHFSPLLMTGSGNLVY